MSSPTSPRPAAKRIKLEGLTPTAFDVETSERRRSDPEIEDIITADLVTVIEEEEVEDSCSICLHSIVDRTVIPKCSHEFCFECLLVWTEQSRRCPLCSQAIGEYLIHSIRSRYDYRKHYLSPLRTSPPPSRPAQASTIQQTTRQNATRRRREAEWGTRGPRVREHEEFDKLERSVIKRRWIYQHDLYAKHVASNSYTKYLPYPTPSQFATSQELISRTTTFLRRELQIWEGLDIEFLTNLIISLMKAIDIRSESAVKLISEFLDMDVLYTPGGRHVNAEHFTHEVYSYVRSPYRDLFVYDKVAQYDLPSGISLPPDIERSRRWHPPSPSHPAAGPSQDNNSRRLQSTSRSSERSDSWSPSGKQYRSSRTRATLDEPGTLCNKNDADSSHHPPKYVLHQDRGRQHHANISDDKIVDDVEEETCGDNVLKAWSSNNFASSSSSTKNINHMPIGAEKYSLKGKGRAYEKESSDSVADFESIGPPTSVGNLEPALTLPTELFELNDVFDSVSKTQISGRPTNLRTLRLPRNNTLLDSVKAHLAGNSNFNTNPNYMSVPRACRHSGNTKASTTPSVSVEFSPISRDQLTNNTPPSNSNTQVPLMSTGLQEETRFMDSSRVGRQVSNHIISNTRERRLRGNLSDLSLSSTPIEQTELYATGVTLEIDSSAQCDGTISAGKSMISPNAIIDAPSPPSSSNSRTIHDNHDICAAEATLSRIEETGSEIPLELSSNKTPLESNTYPVHDIEDSASKSFSFRNHANKIAVHDVQDPSSSNMVYSPIRKDTYTGTASITVVNQSTIPHAINARTRLLARLEFEKKQAYAPGLQDDAEARVLREQSAPTSSSLNAASEDVDAPSLVDHDTHPSLQSNTKSGSLKRYSCAHTDPDPGSAEEDVRAREAKLRARVQLRARLAAEKRIVGGS